MPEVKIRSATKEDLDAICRLGDQVNRYHHLHAPELFAALTDAQRDRDFWLNAVEPQNGTMLLACDEQAVVGFVTVSWSENAAIPFLCVRKICRVGSIVVADDQQGRGVGQLLMDAALAWGKAQGAVEVRLDVFDFNRNAIAFYEHLGFSRLLKNSPPLSTGARGYTLCNESNFSI